MIPESDVIYFLLIGMTLGGLIVGMLWAAKEMDRGLNK